MVECWLPYGNTEVYVTINMRDLLGVAEPVPQEPSAPPRDLISKALAEPRGGKSLRDLVGPDCSVAVAVEASTTPQVAVHALSVLVERLVALIVPKEKINVILACGTRERAPADLAKAIRGEEALRGVSVVEHTRSSSRLAPVGATNKGTPVSVNGAYAEAKLKIAVGEVRVDAYTGFSGAHTAVLPGVSSYPTAEANRRLMFKGDVKPAVMELNPVKEDAFEAVRLAGLDLAVNLVTSHSGKLLAAFAGGFEETLGQAVYALGSGYQVEAMPGADVVVVSAGGARFDSDLYSATWALQGVGRLAKRGAAIILLAECVDGLGSDAYLNLASVEQPAELERRYQLGTEALQLLKATTAKNDVWLVSTLPRFQVEALGVKMARTGNEAYEKACEARRGRKTLVLPYGCGTVPNVAPG